MKHSRDTLSFLGHAFCMKDAGKLDQAILTLGSEIFREGTDPHQSLLDPQYYTGQLMEWAMQDEDFKIALFRFVDVLPSLSDSRSVVAIAQEYFEPLVDKLPSLLRWGTRTDPSSIPAKVAAQVIRRQVRSVAERFIIGESPDSAMKTLRRIRRSGIAFTIDLLGEATLSEAESKTYLERYLELLDALKEDVPHWPEGRKLIANHRGEDTILNISVKLSALYSQARPLNAKKSVQVLGQRLAQIFEKAKECRAFVYVDMEDSSLTDIIIDTFRSVVNSSDFRNDGRWGIVLQAYLRRTAQDVASLVSWAKTLPRPIGVRLVKGAYWDTEVILARQRGWGVPVWEEKSATDAAYEELTRVLLTNSDVVMPAFGSHNIRSLVHAVLLAEALGVPKTHYELQALYGMAEPIKQSFAKRGYLLRDYAPIGELIPGMGYLVRRLLENTSNEGFLRQGFHEHEDPKILLARPTPTQPEDASLAPRPDPRHEFSNIPASDFSNPELRGALEKEIAIFSRPDLKKEIVQPIIGGRKISTEKTFLSNSVEDPKNTLAEIHAASQSNAQEAIKRLKAFHPTWRDTSVTERAEILFRTAEILDRDRMSLSALMVLECGKQWAEADGDVAEAIDFLNYYALLARDMFRTRLMGDYPGERNTYFYEPRGVTAVIGPWNFPLAIPCGMFSAALVTGNCAALKPAEQSTLIALRMFQAFLEAGLPPEAAAFLPGVGEDIGPILVEHPDVSTIVFTGSKAVGLSIIQTAAALSASGEHVKRVIAEMGGKNAIIVDESADLDEAVRGVITSAFGFQGQKCSACSRLYATQSIYEKFTERLREAVKSIIVAPASNPASMVGPVIDAESAARLTTAIQHAKKDCTVIAEGSGPPSAAPSSNYIPPIVFGDIPRGHSLLSQELFGPVLALVRVSSFDEALALAMESEYALTGAVFSRSPKNIAQAAREFRVGNLYINRASTGALVMRQPFGGARKSGVGSKAGGPDYLHQFVIPRSIAENTVRRGFAPED